MANILDETGLTIKTYNEIKTDFENNYKTIYGNDIIIDSNSPDGQRIGIETQAILDNLQLQQEIYNSFDPDVATGTILDQRVSLNNIERQNGTFTLQQVYITTDRALTLQGLDENVNNIDGVGYTISDNAGNQFILTDTTSILTAGTYLLTFRAKELGAITTIPNTITNPIDIILGVTAINNTSGALEVGINEETDNQLRYRRRLSVSIASQGYLNGLLGYVLNLDGVTEACLFENTKLQTINGIEPKSIWLIVEGGSNVDIANAINLKKNGGCGMQGNVSYEIITESGQIFIAKFDRPLSKNLYIRFEIQPTTSSSFDEDEIKSYIVLNKTYKIADYAETSSLTYIISNAITQNGGGGIPVNVEISKDNINWFDFLETDTLQEKWIISASNITITIL
jgi:uncharacterized phage protein gp47/JayE